jgi:DNA-binding response OmpR family regulator
LSTVPPPPSPPAKPSPSASPSRASAAAAAQSVLVVEDDDSSARALALLLRRFGWTVDVVATVADANAYLDAQRPTAVILDLMLPDGEGATVLARVREAKMDVRVTVTTASSDPDRLNRVRALRPDSLLRKPIDLTELLRVL